jgi:hypothetical protein
MTDETRPRSTVHGKDKDVHRPTTAALRFAQDKQKQRKMEKGKGEIKTMTDE